MANAKGGLKIALGPMIQTSEHEMPVYHVLLSSGPGFGLRGSFFPVVLLKQPEACLHPGMSCAFG